MNRISVVLRALWEVLKGPAMMVLGFLGFLAIVLVVAGLMATFPLATKIVNVACVGIFGVLVVGLIGDRVVWFVNEFRAKVAEIEAKE